jgi:hypothetical protein
MSAAGNAVGRQVSSDCKAYAVECKQIKEIFFFPAASPERQRWAFYSSLALRGVKKVFL